MSELYQCLIFLIQKKRDASGRSLRRLSAGSGCKGYALIPEELQLKCPRINEIFTQNYLQVLKSEPILTLENVTVEVVELLLEVAQSESVSVLAENHNKEIVNSLFRKNTIKLFIAQFSCDHVKSLHSVDVKSNNKVLEDLLRHQSNITLRHPKGGTLLHLAVARKNAALVELLLKSGADVNSARHADAATPLVLAVSEDDSLDITRSLLKSGANIGAFCYFKRSGDLSPHQNVRDYLVGGTPLHYAIDSCHFEAAELILGSDIHINVDEPCGDGRTPLQLAVDFGSAEITQALFKHHPDINNAKNHQSFLDAFIIDDQLVRVMRNHGFRLKPEDCTPKLLCSALHLRYIQIVRDILTLGVDLKSVDEKGRPASASVLKHAAMADVPLEVWKLLLNIPGIDINARNSPQNESPIVCVLNTANNLEILKLFIHNGLNVFENVPSASYKSSFVECALEAWKSELVEIVLNHGADVNCKEGSAITYGATTDHMKVLLTYGAQIDDSFKPLHDAVNYRYSNNFQMLLDYCLSNEKLYKNMRSITYFPNLPRLRNGKFRRFCHLIKYECLHVPDKNGWQKLEHRDLNVFRDKCIIEIGLLKTEKVVPSSVITFYDLLVGNVSNICKYARNDEFTQTLLSDEYKNKFPAYCEAVYWQFRRGFYRRKLIGRGVRVLPLISESFSALPHEILEYSVDHLTNLEILLMISDRSYICEPLM